MSVKKENRGSTVQTYRLRVPIYENEEGRELLRKIARRRGCSMAAAVRQLIREEASRKGLTEAPDEPTSEGAEQERPFWRRALETARAIPSEERERFPVDGAEQLDHYVYGIAKRSRGDA